MSLVDMDLTLSSFIISKKRKRIVSTKEKMMNLVRAVEGETTTDAALSRLADSLLDPCRSRDLAAIRPLVPRILAVVGPLLLMDDDNNDTNPSSGSLFLTKAKLVVVNLTQAAGLQAVVFALDPYLYDDAEHVRLTAIKVLDEIVRTLILATEQEVPQHLKYLMSDVLKTGLTDKSSVRVRREAALCIASLAKVCAGPPRVEIFRTWELSKAAFLKSLCSTIGLLIDQDDDIASSYFGRELLLDIYQLLLESDAGEIKALDRETTRAVLEILVQCARLQGEEADAAMYLVVSQFGRQFWGKSEALDTSEKKKLVDVMIKMGEKVVCFN